MSAWLKSFDWLNDKQFFQTMPMKIPYFSLAQRKVPKETRLFARPALDKHHKTVAQKYVHPTYPLPFRLRRTVFDGTMPAPRPKPLKLSLLWLQKGNGPFEAFERSPLKKVADTNQNQP